MRVEATGQKVTVQNGQISVTNPTTPGNELNTSFEITEKNSGFAIGVGGTVDGDLVHYLDGESWLTPNEHVVIEDNGDQRLKVPNATAGASATVRTSTLRASPQSDVSIELLDTDSTPRFEVGPAVVTGDSVDYTLTNAESSVEYALVSETQNDLVRDKAVADGSVTLTDDDASEVLEIRTVQDSGSTDLLDGSDGAGTGAISVDSATNEAKANPMLVMGGAAVLLLLTGFASRRLTIPAKFSVPAVVVVGALAIESISPGTISGSILSLVDGLGSGLSTVSPLLIIGVAGVALWAVVKIIGSRFGSSNDTLVIRGNNK